MFREAVKAALTQLDECYAALDDDDDLHEDDRERLYEILHQAEDAYEHCLLLTRGD